jgi:ABC-2 type transport system permease protein
MSALGAVMYREGRIRATNAMFIFWDVMYPIAYLLVFGAAMDEALAFETPSVPVEYNAFFLAGVLGMASFGIASNTAWSFFMDRDNGIFYEMLTYPISRWQYLVGKVAFNSCVAVTQALLTLVLAAVLLDVPVRLDRLPLLSAMVVGGTAGWFFFYAIFALQIRRNDAFNTVTSIFYFIFLFASPMFYPVDALPAAFRIAAYANPITWQVDVLRYATIGLGSAGTIALETAAFAVFSVISFVVAVWSLRSQG